MRKRLDPNDTLSIARHKYKILYSPEELGASGPPPSDEEDITTVLGKSLLERAGLSRRGGGDGSRRYNAEDDSAGQLKKKPEWE
jgi:adenylate cyclase